MSFYSRMNGQKTLIIVESPSKCKKIESYLGPSYKVIASCGHFTKLDSLDQIQMDTFQISYKISNGKILKFIKEEIQNSRDVILATDDDREGEAIAWALCVFCKLDIRKTKKMVFQEITKNALEKALQNIGAINMDRVRSQQARQILNIYLGYRVSPLLWKYVQHKLSAGRCQTPALHLIYENEAECNSLSEDTHFTIKALFTSKNVLFQGQGPIEKNDMCEYMKRISEKDSWLLKNKKERQIKEEPPRILITSTLQQKAHQIFRFSPKATMKYAQELYENGLITYMRTDSACYSLDFTNKLKKHITDSFGESYVRKDLSFLQQNRNKNKSQEAHEGIRVCDLNKKTSELKTKSANILYQFIYKHSIQCAMSPAIYKETVFYIHDESCGFKHVDKTSLFRGWTLLQKDKSTPSFVSFLNSLLESQTPFCLSYAEANESLIQIKSHYHEASLIQKLEALNIGRPSTYASIIESILSKNYVVKEDIEGKKKDILKYIYRKGEAVIKQLEEKILHKEQKKLHITPLGKQVCEFCMTHFTEMFSYDFTNDMESQLDDIEYGTVKQHDVIRTYLSSLDKHIQETKELYQSNPDKIKKTKDTSLHCGSYQNDPIYIKHGKFGYYLCIGKKDKISLKEFCGFCIETKLNERKDITNEEYQYLIDFIKNRESIRNENICLELSSACSLRKSKYGYYIFYQTKTMKKPKFLKYNDEKDESTDLRNQWIETKDRVNISNYVSKKYNMTI